MPQNHKLGKANTKVLKKGGAVSVVYYGTEVVRFDEHRIVLSSGGFDTMATRLRQNQAASQFGLGYFVASAKGQTTVEFCGQIVPFVDGMELSRANAAEINSVI